MNNTIVKKGNDFKVMRIEYNEKLSAIYDVIAAFMKCISKTTNPVKIFLLGRHMQVEIYGIQSKPYPPKFRKGGIEVIDKIKCECEYYETPDGVKYRTTMCDYCRSKIKGEDTGSFKDYGASFGMGN